MSTVPIVRPISKMVFPAWLAIASGEAGLVSFCCLMTYLFTPAFHMDESGAMPRTARVLMDTNFLAAMLQALFMLPMVGRLAGMSSQRSPVPSRIAFLLGITGFSLVALFRVLTILHPAVSDILFMAPIGLTGMWLFIVNWLSKGSYARALQILGMIAAVFLIGVGLNFVFNGGLAVLTKGPLAYGNDVPFHIGLALTGAPAFTLFPFWSILLGIRFLKAPDRNEQMAG
jgi:hypothetical protein